MILNPWIWDRSRAKSEKPLVSFEGRYFTAISFDFCQGVQKKTQQIWVTFSFLNQRNFGERSILWIEFIIYIPTSNQMTHPISVNIQIEVLKSPKLGSAPKKNARRRISFTSWTLAPNGAHLWRSVRRGAGNATRLWPGEWNYHLSSGC